MSPRTIRQITCEVTENPEVARGIHRLSLAADAFPESAAPGQFVMVRTSDSLDPLLRRAFSIHDMQDREIKLLYKVVGRGTAWLSARGRGDAVDLLGPLGRGFQIPAEVKRAWLVAGGMGVAPFQFLIRALHARGVDTTLFFGARSAEETVEFPDLERLDSTLVLATEDGSRGEKGRITEVFARRVRSLLVDETCRAYACGPGPMLPQVSRICREVGAACEVSLETEMACGLGTCTGCVVRTRKGYQRVCREGPVFFAEEVLWEASDMPGRFREDKTVGS